MSQPRQSLALVIVNTDFHSSNGDVSSAPRKGAKREAEKLSTKLSQLNYEVKLMHNKTAKEIEDLYQQECCCEHGEYFVSIISSHGEEGVILGCDSEPVKLTRIFQILSSKKVPGAHQKSPKSSLSRWRKQSWGKLMTTVVPAGLPGARIRPRGVVVECDSREPEPDGFSDYLSSPPQTAVMFACSPGYVAFLNIFGSMFLQALLKVLEGEERHLALKPPQ
ncbi:LOW QUALITY PROTEIN: caspase-3-like [Pluvialis apricaria]